MSSFQDRSDFTLDAYQRLALRTLASQGEEGVGDIICTALGLAGESGEFCDHVKKWQFQGHQGNREILIEELGDVLWYVATGAQALGLSLSDLARRNVEKLERRYPNGFEVERSVNICDACGL